MSVCQQAAQEGLSLLLKQDSKVIGCVLIEHAAAPFEDTGLVEHTSLRSLWKYHENGETSSLHNVSDSAAHVFLVTLKATGLPENLLLTFFHCLTDFLQTRGFTAVAAMTSHHEAVNFVSQHCPKTYEIDEGGLVIGDISLMCRKLLPYQEALFLVEEEFMRETTENITKPMANL